jgi:hypothetical protein
MLRREFRQSNLEAFAAKKAPFFGPFADLVVFEEFHSIFRLANDLPISRERRSSSF